MALLLEADTNTRDRAARKLFASAVDWLLQIGFDHDGRRRVFQLVEVEDRSRDGEVQFRRLVQYEGNGRWRQIAQPVRRRGYQAEVPDSWHEIRSLDERDRERFQGVLDRRRAAFKSA